MPTIVKPLFALLVANLVASVSAGAVGQVQQESQQEAPTAEKTEYLVETLILRLPCENPSAELPPLLQGLISRIDLDDVEVVGGAQLIASTIGPSGVPATDIAPVSVPNKNRTDHSDSNQSALYLRLNNAELDSFEQSLNTDAKAQLMQAPTITTFANVQSEIQSGAHRPFVTGVQELKQDDRVGFQPVVSAFFEGVSIKLELQSAQTNELNLVGELQLSEIKAVNAIAMNSETTAGTASTPEERTLQIQFPLVEVAHYPISKRVHLGDHTLIVLGRREVASNDNNATSASGSKKIFRKNSNDREQFFDVVVISISQLTAERTAQSGDRKSLSARAPLPRVYSLRRDSQQ